MRTTGNSFYEDGSGVRVGWMKASKFPWYAALFSGSALRCGQMDMASVFGTEGRRFEPHDGCIIVLGYSSPTARGERGRNPYYNNGCSTGFESHGPGGPWPEPVLQQRL